MFQEVLRLSHDRSLNKYASIDEEDDFQVKFHIIVFWSLLQHSFSLNAQLKISGPGCWYYQ